MRAIGYIDIIQELENGIERTEANLLTASVNARKCGKSSCCYCDRLGRAKATFTKSKLLFSEFTERLKSGALPRTIFGTHIRKEYGNYQGWILANGHYVDVWKIGGHSLSESICIDTTDDLKIKVHSQGKRSDIIFFNGDFAPTEAQMETVLDMATDSILWNHVLTFRFSYDAFHPDPEFEIPF